MKIRLTAVSSFFALMALACAAFAQSAAGTWKIDPNHSSAQFSVRHMMVSNVKGTFQKLSGTVQYDPANISNTKIEATIDTATVNTNQESRDKDLRSADFFDVGKFPTMTFKSTKVEAAGGGKLKMTGDLTIHGVTRQVTFEVDGPSPAIKDPSGLRMGASATTKINRRDFGLNYNRMIEAGAVVGDEVAIDLEIEMVKPSAAPAS